VGLPVGRAVLRVCFGRTFEPHFRGGAMDCQSRVESRSIQIAASLSLL